MAIEPAGMRHGALMILSLFTFTLLTALVLFVLGLLFLLGRPGWREAVCRFPRSDLAAYVTMGIGGGWFLYTISQLSPADELFGPATRPVLLVVFGVTWIGSFFVVKDFLAVRGLAVLVLMCAATGLATAFGEYEIPARLLLVTVLYAFIVLAIYLGVSPFRWRDFFDWLFAKRLRNQLMGGVFTLCGLLLVGAALAY